MPPVLHVAFEELPSGGTQQVLPGEVSTVRYTFKRPGEYRIICNQYCGLGHQNMFGTIVVKE